MALAYGSVAAPEPRRHLPNYVAIKTVNVPPSQLGSSLGGWIENNVEERTQALARPYCVS